VPPSGGSLSGIGSLHDVTLGERPQLWRVARPANVRADPGIFADAASKNYSITTHQSNLTKSLKIS